MVPVLCVAVLLDLSCPPDSAHLGVVASTLEGMSDALAQAERALWAGEAENVDLIQRIMHMQ